MSVLTDPVLVLNNKWQPLDTYSVQKALTHVCGGMAKVYCPEDVFFVRTDVETGLTEDVHVPQYSLLTLEEWADLPVPDGLPAITTARSRMRIPEIIVLASASGTYRQRLNCSKRNVSNRDNHQCQYCGERIGGKEQTLEHIIPRMRKGPNAWHNVVIACKECNCRKGHKPLEEAGMRLIDRPELKALHPHDPSKWNRPYEPAWSAVHKVAPFKRKASWSQFV